MPNFYFYFKIPLCVICVVYFSRDKELVNMMYAKGTNALEVYLDVKNPVRNDSVMPFEQFQKIREEANKQYDLELSETYLERMTSKEDLEGMDCFGVFDDIAEEFEQAKAKTKHRNDLEK